MALIGLGYAGFGSDALDDWRRELAAYHSQRGRSPERRRERKQQRRDDDHRFQSSSSVGSSVGEGGVRRNDMRADYGGYFPSRGSSA